MQGSNSKAITLPSSVIKKKGFIPRVALHLLDKLSPPPAFRRVNDALEFLTG